MIVKWRVAEHIDRDLVVAVRHTVLVSDRTMVFETRSAALGSLPTRYSDVQGHGDCVRAFSEIR